MRPNLRHQAWMDNTDCITRNPASNFTHNTFFQEIKPLLYTLRATGRFPYNFTDNGIISFSMMSFPAFYSCLFYIATSYFSYRTLMLLRETYIKSNNYNETLQVIILVVYITQNFVVPLTYWFQGPKLVKYIKMWSIFESEFQKESRRMRYHRWVLCLILIAFGHTFIGVYPILGNFFKSGLVFLPFVISAYMSIMLWILSQRKLIQKVHKLSKKILMEGLRYNLDRKRRCWVSISRLTSGLGDALGWALGGLSVSIFFTFLISIYGFFTSLLDGGSVEWQLIVPALLCCLYFYFMFDTAEWTSNEVGTKFSSMVFRIKCGALDCKALNEIPLFLLTMSTFRPNIMFSGFISVNRGLFVTFAANTLTFLLVLVQFKN